MAVLLLLGQQLLLEIADSQELRRQNTKLQHSDQEGKNSTFPLRLATQEASAFSQTTCRGGSVGHSSNEAA